MHEKELFFKIIKYALVGFVLLSVFSCIFINYAMEKETSQKYSSETRKEFAIVLGASVHGGELSEALRARMLVAIDLYRKGVVKNILLSGDGTDEYYSETVVMKKFALSSGIPEEYILTDEKGYNTYATMIRASEVFNAKSAYIISQNFHLARSVWVAKECGIDAQGVSAGKLEDPWYYYIREFFARVKDYIQVKFKITFY